MQKLSQLSHAQQRVTILKFWLSREKNKIGCQGTQMALNGNSSACLDRCQRKTRATCKPLAWLTRDLITL